MEIFEREMQSRGTAFTKIAVITYFLLWTVAILIIYLRETWHFSILLCLFGDTSLEAQLLWGVSFAAIFIIISLIAHHVSPVVRRGEYDLKEVLGDVSLFQIISLALVSSIGEEFFFRGALQPYLGLWLASFFFGLVHFPSSKNLAFYPVATFIVGLGLGWLFKENGNGLCAPIVAHFIINLVGLYRINRLLVECQVNN